MSSLAWPDAGYAAVLSEMERKSMTEYIIEIPDFSKWDDVQIRLYLAEMSCDWPCADNWAPLVLNELLKRIKADDDEANK